MSTSAQYCTNAKSTRRAPGRTATEETDHAHARVRRVPPPPTRHDLSTRCTAAAAAVLPAHARTLELCTPTTCSTYARDRRNALRANARVSMKHAQLISSNALLFLLLSSNADYYFLDNYYETRTADYYYLRTPLSDRAYTRARIFDRPLPTRCAHRIYARLQ